MMKKIKQYFEKRKQLKEQTVELKKMQKYYDYLRTGVAFVQFVQNDLKKSSDKMNRHQRRRLQKTVLKGEFNEELINYYKNEIDRILREVEKRLNPSKPVDGAEFYKQAKKETVNGNKVSS